MVVRSVTPVTGTALIFNHDTMHEGEPVTMGTKYIIRTEIMYRRVDTEMLPDPGAYQREENYIKTLTLYQKSWKLEQGAYNTTCAWSVLQCTVSAVRYVVLVEGNLAIGNVFAIY